MENDELERKVDRWGIKAKDLSQEVQQALLELAVANAVAAYTERGT